MRAAGHDRNHGGVTTSPVVPRRLYRRPDLGIAGGVATGIAVHLGVSRRLVRLVFVALSVAGGLGIALYGTYLIVLPTAPDAGRGRFPPWLEYLVAGLAAAAAVAVAASSLPRSGLFVPALLACLGGALIWRQASEPERGRIWALSRTGLIAPSGERLGRVRLAAGAALVIAGAAVALARANVTAIREGLIAMIVTVVGLVLLTGPWWMRMMAQLTSERAERIRSQERADIAARLHDSVMQTLALIQRNAGSPREVTRLARGQERELRALLYGDRPMSAQFADELRVAAAEVEDSYGVPVEVVIVGDGPLDSDLTAMTAAAREALANAAKHSQAETISLYAELEPDQASIFVKDRGVGFATDTVADDRHGVRGSIVDRMQRHGGHARVNSEPGAGTEVELRMPRSRPDRDG